MPNLVSNLLIYPDMSDLNALRNLIKDLDGRAAALRGYL